MIYDLLGGAPSGCMDTLFERYASAFISWDSRKARAHVRAQAHAQIQAEVDVAALADRAEVLGDMSLWAWRRNAIWYVP